MNFCGEGADFLEPGSCIPCDYPGNCGEDARNWLNWRQELDMYDALRSVVIGTELWGGEQVQYTWSWDCSMKPGHEQCEYGCPPGMDCGCPAPGEGEAGMCEAFKQDYCRPDVLGCMCESAQNYNPDATANNPDQPCDYHGQCSGDCQFPFQCVPHPSGPSRPTDV
jgi:hypothetical protein